ncbi:uncharacterized protein LOC111714194 [Eurytemora carolleeae]|uniref:uncharacterized protein LOC111714194 n=1 Tax=Eurytemora carolleeae TaxID=1294199 RepID=UPI000C756DAC|nr:uncharacterized protein LOC111714194 [Eurytemora carolleeae]|eukprot:XP_023345012.1 uncharacterized protein LOC111714194 [Eurytemora affinis]
MIMQCAAMSPEKRENVIKQFRKFRLPFLRDMKLFLLMVAVLLYDPLVPGLENPQAVEAIQKEYKAMLRRYVLVHSGVPEEFGMSRVHNCLASLSIIAEVLLEFQYK